MGNIFNRSSVFLFVYFLALIAFGPHFVAHASMVGGTPSESAIATMAPFAGSDVAYGDVVAFDDAAQIYVLADASSALGVFGVVIRDPALLLMPEEIAGKIPVINSGPVLVNVTLEGGPIAAGDSLAPSSIPGKARRASAGENSLGIATEAFSGDGGVSLRSPDGRQFLSGTITVNVDPLGMSAPPQLMERCVSAACRFVDMLNPEILASFTRYSLSGVIAALSLVFAFKSFMTDANYGVISIGRNPSAKTSIRSLVFFNALFALAIAGVGLFAAIVVLFAGA